MNSNAPEYTLLDHTADLGISVNGADLKTLFENAARSMMHIIVRGNSSEKPRTRNISVSGSDLADLMVRWLGEILYLFQGDNIILVNATISSISSTRLDAVITTISFDPAFHEIFHDIKAVTYHQIEVAKKEERWETRVIFDL